MTRVARVMWWLDRLVDGAGSLRGRHESQLKLRDLSFQIPARMGDSDSSGDDVELVEADSSVELWEVDSSVELVELDSSVELISVCGGEGEGQVSPPGAQAPPRAQRPPAVQGLVGGVLARPVPPQVLGFTMALVRGLEVCRLKRAGRVVPHDLLGCLGASPAWVATRAAHHVRRVVYGARGGYGGYRDGQGGALGARGHGGGSYGGQRGAGAPVGAATPRGPLICFQCGREGHRRAVCPGLAGAGGAGGAGAGAGHGGAGSGGP